MSRTWAVIYDDNEIEIARAEAHLDADASDDDRLVFRFLFPDTGQPPGEYRARLRLEDELGGEVWLWSEQPHQKYPGYENYIWAYNPDSRKRMEFLSGA